MLIIRDVQMRVLARGVLTCWLMRHVRRHFPRHAAALGEAGLEQTIDTAAARARALGFESDQDICHYVDLSIMFGSRFEERPDGQWGAVILADGSIRPEERMGRLYAAALQHLHRIAAAGAARA